MKHRLIIFNNLTRTKEEFIPISDGEVKFYSCGPTPYDLVHIGNALAMVVGDLVHRIFRAFDYKVEFVRNFTDVDDKIIARAEKKGVDALKYSAEMMKECITDMKFLGMLPPTHTPKVTETIPEIIDLIKTLVDKGHAYEIDGEVLFHVPKFKAYGKLSKKSLENLQHGIRVDVDKRKKHPSDFVLWKPAKEGEPSWDSPWGKGRPGWHIECSAMIKKFLGERIDIHHGGIDLMFPHHENEIAQSEAASGKTFSNFWIHNEFLNFEGDKMSKSLGNVINIRQFVNEYGGEVLRHIFASSHYRSKINWGVDVIERAIHEVERIHSFIMNYHAAKDNNFGMDAHSEFLGIIHEVIPLMKDELGNDFNVPGALSHFFSMIRLVNREFLDENKNYAGKKKLNQELVEAIDEVLAFVQNATGLIYDDHEDLISKLNTTRKNLHNVNTAIPEDQIEKLIAERQKARKEKNWARADEIRTSLTQGGIVIKDNPDGTVSWSYK